MNGSNVIDITVKKGFCSHCMLALTTAWMEAFISCDTRKCVCSVGINRQNYSRETVCFSSCSRELWKVLAWFQHLSGSFFPSVTSDDSLDLSQTAAKAGKGALHCRGGTGSKLRLPGETTAEFWTDSIRDLWTRKVLEGNSPLVSDYEAVAIYSPS